jgi:hypothetical protein
LKYSHYLFCFSNLTSSFNAGSDFKFDWTVSTDNIGQSGTIIINNTSTSTPDVLPDITKTPDGADILFVTASDSTSVMSYYIAGVEVEVLLIIIVPDCPTLFVETVQSNLKSLPALIIKLSLFEKSMLAVLLAIVTVSEVLISEPVMVDA